MSDKSESETTQPYKILDSDAKDKVKRLSYEYIFYLSTEWYMDRHDIKDLSTFDAHNKLTTSKLFLFPFYYATANGCSESLYEIMSPFKMREDGLVSTTFETMSLNHLYKKNKGVEKEEDSFNFFETDCENNRKNKFGLGIKDLKKYNSLEELRNIILDKEVKEGIKFRDIKVSKDDNKECSLYNSLESSNDLLKKQTDEKFIDYDFETFSIITRQYSDFGADNDNNDNIVLYEKIRKLLFTI